MLCAGGALRPALELCVCLCACACLSVACACMCLCACVCLFVVCLCVPVCLCVSVCCVCVCVCLCAPVCCVCVELMMICSPSQGPPPQHCSRHGPQRTQHAASTAATPRYPQGKDKPPQTLRCCVQVERCGPVSAFLKLRAKWDDGRTLTPSIRAKGEHAPKTFDQQVRAQQTYSRNSSRAKHETPLPLRRTQTSHSSLKQNSTLRPKTKLPLKPKTKLHPPAKNNPPSPPPRLTSQG